MVKRLVSASSQHEHEVRRHYRDLASDYGSRANRTCEQIYRKLVMQFLASRERVLEVGCGSNNLLDYLDSTHAVGCDLSIDMLRARIGNPRSQYVAAVGEALPFRDAQFDGLFLINVLEHVTNVEAVIDECARVLKNGGICIAVTPNGNWEFWLDLAERWKLKLPEGPHTFLTFAKLRHYFQMSFDVFQHRTFLLLPAGPPAVAALIDKVSFSAFFKSGFFQFIVAKKTPSQVSPYLRRRISWLRGN